MLRIIWKAGCLETCTSGLGLGPRCDSAAYTTISLDRRCATPGPATDRVRKREKRRGREPRDFAGSTPVPVTEMIPWSNGEGAWVTTRKAVVRLPPGSLDGL